MNTLVSHHHSPWQPAWSSNPLTFDLGDKKVTNNRSSHDWVREWTPRFLKSYSDFQPVGTMFTLADWQAWAIESSCELDYEGYWRYRTYLLMVSRKNGKTEIAATLVLSHLLTAPDYAEIYSCAVDRRQARICYDKVRRWIEETPALAKIFKVQSHENRITNTLTGAYYEALPADPSSAQGKNPYFIVMDELHVWDDGGDRSAHSAQAFYDAMVSAAGARRQSQVFIISTAGENVNDTILGKLYKKAIAISKGEMKDETFGYAIWEVPADADPLDEKNWYMASPNLAEGLMSIAYLRSMLLEFSNLNINSFFRYFLNQWVRTTGETYISEFHWKEAGDSNCRIPAGAKVVAGFDGSINNDSTVIVVMELETGIFTTWDLWEKDYNDPEWAVDRDSVRDSFRRLRDTYDVVEVRVDGTYWSNDLKKWAKELGLRFQAFPQSASRLTPAGDEFINDLIDGNIKHNNNPDLTRHVMNATRSSTGKPQKENPKSRHKIDLLMGAIFANNARIWYLERAKRKANLGVGVIGF